MASIVSAGTTSATALNMSADTTGVLQLASNNGTVALTIGTSQNIGFGTTSPNFECHISTGSATSITQPTAGSYGLYVQQNTSGSVGGIYIQDCASNSGNSLVIADNNGVIRAIVDGEGNLGLSVNTPSSIGKLAVSGTVGLANNSILRFYNSANNNWSVIDNPATDGTGPLRFQTGAGEVARFENGGNFLIGSSTNNGGRLQMTSDSTRMLSNGNGQYRVFNQVVQKASNTTSACAITFASQGSAHTSHIVEIFFAAAQDDANGGVGGTATFVLASLTTVGILSEIQDLGTGVSFAGSVSGSVLTITATMTSNRNVVAWTVKVTSTYSVGAPTSISVT